MKDTKKPQHGGNRPNSGRKATGRKNCSIYVTEEELIKVREFINSIRTTKQTKEGNRMNQIQVGQRFLSRSKKDTHWQLYRLNGIIEGVVTNSYIINEVHTGNKYEVKPEWFNQRKIELVSGVNSVVAPQKIEP